MAFKVYCRECSWKASDPVDLKGEANWLAGRHISDTGHSVAVKETEDHDESEPKEFLRSNGSDDGSIEIIRAVGTEEIVGEVGTEVRQCGPVECVVATVGGD